MPDNHPTTPVPVREFQGKGQIPQSVTVTTTSTQLLAANDNRVSLIISNTGNMDAFMAWDVAAEQNRTRGLYCGKILR